MQYNSTINKKIIRNLFLIILLVFIQLSTFSQVFTSSNLPIIIINTDNSATILDDPRILGNMKIIYNGPGIQNFVTDQNNSASLNYNGRIDIEIRGSSSQSVEKKSYGLTTKLADNVSNNNVSLLGMPSENDWVLNGLAFEAGAFAGTVATMPASSSFCFVIVRHSSSVISPRSTRCH